MTTYSANDISVLTAVEAFREKVGMYAGGAGLGVEDNTGVVKTALEIIDNSIDEIMNGYGSEIRVTVKLLNSGMAQYTVQDFGRGIPFDKYKDGRSALEVLLSDAHAGGKMSANDNYKTSGGTNGIGASLTNATSSQFMATSVRGEKGYRILWKDGVKAKEDAINLKGNKTTGTTITWIPSLEAFTETKTTVIPEDKMISLMRFRSFLNTGAKIVLNYDGEVHEFLSNDSFDFIKWEVKNTLKDSLVVGQPRISGHAQRNIKNRDGKDGSIECDLLISFTKTYDKGDAIYPFCNMIQQLNGGTHMQGFKMGLPRPFLKYIEDNKGKFLKGRYAKATPEGIDVNNAVVAFISVKHSDPMYSAQDKSKVTNSDLQGLTQQCVGEMINNWLADKANSKVIPEVINRILRNAMLRKSADNAKNKFNKEDEKYESLNRATKLADCSGKDRTEVFFTEGESAAGTAKNGRDGTFQAIMALTGKIPNLFDVAVKDLLKSEKIKDLVGAIGITPKQILERSGVPKYDNYIILTDADYDGSHIRCLLIAFFRECAPYILTEGRLFIAVPPMYRVATANGKVEYIEDKDQQIEYIGKRASKAELVVAGTNKQISASIIMNMMQHTESYHGAIIETSRIMRLSMDLIESIFRNTSAFELFKSSLVSKKLPNYIALLSKLLKDEKPEFYHLDKNTKLMQGLYQGDFVLVDTNNLVEYNKLLHNVAKMYYNSIKNLGLKSIEIKFIDNKGNVIGLAAAYDYLYAIATKGINITYLKGLGEMSADQLWETTLNPETRKLYRVEYNPDSDVMFTFMHKSDKAISSRRDIILNNINEFITD